MSFMNGAGGGGRVASVGMGEEGVREANVGAVRRISGVITSSVMRMTARSKSNG